jgi:glycosyltransferase involved in cell wall biosynthesis
VTGTSRASNLCWTITLPHEGRDGAQPSFPGDEQQRLVSCIIIFLDEEKYLAEAIESVIAQSYANWELILVDDGSTDGSEAIARSYCERFPGKIRYLTHDGRANRGMSASRNLGLHLAAGEFVAFLDGDDCWYPNKLERQIALFDEHPEAVMVCGATTYWNSWDPASPADDEVKHVGQRTDAKGRVLLGLQLDSLYGRGQLIGRLYPLGKGLTPSSSGNMMRRHTVSAVGGYNEAFRGMFEDQVFRAKMYFAGPIYVSSEVFDRYRQHFESCYQVQRQTGAADEARQQYFLWLREYLDQVGVRDWTVRLQWRRKMLRYDFPRLRRVVSRLRSLLGS